MRAEQVLFTTLFILLTIAAVLIGTALACAREASRTRLLDQLNENHERSADHFFRHRRQYIQSLMILQQVVLLAFAVLLIQQHATIESTPARWVSLVLTAAAWMLVFGVGIPHGWSRHAGDRFLSATLRPLEGLRRAMAPVLALVAGIDEIVRRLSGAPREPTDRAERFETEIMDAVRQGELSGMMNPAEKEIIRSALTLDETSVGEVMTPRTDIVGVDATASFDDVRQSLLSEGHSRVPVYEESLDHIIGILYAKDLLKINDPEDFRMRDAMRPATFVPETKDLSSLLREFQHSRVHIAIVLDEYGGTAGLVTLEDIMEELIGDIADEHDAPPAPPIRRIDERTAEVDARVRVEDLNQSLEIDLPVDDAYDTIAGYVFSKLGRIPAVGDSAEESGVRIEVLDAGDRSIRRLRLRLPEQATASE